MSVKTAKSKKSPITPKNYVPKNYVRARDFDRQVEQLYDAISEKAALINSQGMEVSTVIKIVESLGWDLEEAIPLLRDVLQQAAEDAVAIWVKKLEGAARIRR
jgi:hypothetical protein